MNHALFSEFSSTDFAAWQAQAIKDLKGKDFEATLHWRTPEGFTVAPYYTAEHHTNNLPLPATAGWLNQPVVVYQNEQATNAQLMGALQKGADALILDFADASIDDISLPKLLNNNKLSDAPVVFKTNGQAALLLHHLQRFVPYQMKGGLADDPLANWMQTGFLAVDWPQQTADLLKNTANSPFFRTLCVQSHVFHNAGAHAVQELAFTLSSAATYLDQLTDLGLSLAEITPKIHFSVSVGSNYFMEIAKLRALRYLWATLCDQWQPADNRPPTPVFIQAQTSTFYNAAASPYTNLLRATTQAMSATLGGCDALTVLNYNEIAAQSDDFAARIARNISVLLKDESHFDKTIDPAAGSYFLENLTQQLIEAAWKLFLEVEQKGGLLAAFEQGFVQQQIEEAFEQKRQKAQAGTSVLVGVNKYQTPDDVLVAAATPPKATNSAVDFALLPNRRIADWA